ncbi:hypothetical protein E4U53_005768 [Claviceps sorghi]|nr:hypothetical protein E4U53_005768 [Claviceps sorghi]
MSTPSTQTGRASNNMSATHNSDEAEDASYVGTPSIHGTEASDKMRPCVSEARNLSLQDVAAVHVEIRDLSVSVNTAPSWLEPATYQDLLAARFKTTPRRKKLLHAVTADFKPGTLTAIIGGSGSGKTTLLSVLAGRITSSRLNQTGTVSLTSRARFHNVPYSYVMQHDVLLPTLTVRETLHYSAALRLPSSTSQETRNRVVEEVILELGLKECADSRIGSIRHRGCSGGEKRRVSIGVQLLANPSVLFLDEPTTGLDATSAFQLVRTLKSLAQKGRTIVATIHQPRSEIWNLFDNLLVLSKGQPVYSGSTTDCLPWFVAHGFSLPPFINPAEFIVDVAAVDNRTPELEAETMARVASLQAAWEEESIRRYPPLTDTPAVVTYRDPLGMTASIVEAILMGVVTGYIFFDLGRDQAGIRSREGGLYSVSALQGYLVLLFEVYRLTIDIPAFDQESSDNCVDALPFVISRRLARLPTEDLPVPFLFSVLVYFLAGFERSVSKFFIFLAITILNHYVAVTCAMICVVAARHFSGASLIANMIYTI